MTHFMPQELNGIIVVDKPADITSAKVVSILKKTLAEKKVGHTGTLDPFATGVMVCCVNRATRLARFFLNSEKTYDALLRLGIETDTQDLTGKVVSTCKPVAFSRQDIAAALKRFEGTIEQVPPVYSALKHNGVPLYKLARAGKPFQKSARQVTVSQLTLREINLPEVRLEISCSAGTYIRTLCSDIGRTLGCGGHLKALRRVESCGFSIDEAVSLSEIEAKAVAGRLSELIIPMSDALRNIPEVTVDDRLSEKMLNGHVFSQAEFMAEHRIQTDGYVKIVDKDKNLISVLDIDKKLDYIKYCCVFN